MIPDAEAGGGCGSAIAGGVGEQIGNISSVCNIAAFEAAAA